MRTDLYSFFRVGSGGKRSVYGAWNSSTATNWAILAEFWNARGWLEKRKMEGLEDFRFAVEGIGLVRVMQNISSSKESRQKATKGCFGEMISRKILAICLNSIFATYLTISSTNYFQIVRRQCCLNMSSYFKLIQVTFIFSFSWVYLEWWGTHRGSSGSRENWSRRTSTSSC